MIHQLLFLEIWVKKEEIKNLMISEEEIRVRKLRDLPFLCRENPNEFLQKIKLIEI